MGNKTVYIRFEQNIEVKDRSVNIGQAACVFSSDKSVEARVKSINLINIKKDTKKARYVFLVIDVIRMISKEIPYVVVKNVGEEEFVIDYNNKDKPEIIKVLLKYMSLLFVCLVTFAGSAFSIIAYDNDVDIGGIFDSISNFFGVNNRGNILETCYVAGFALGMIIFYNHFVGKRLSDDPTPVEVEECAYNKEVTEAIFSRDKKRREKYDDDYGGLS